MSLPVQRRSRERSGRHAAESPPDVSVGDFAKALFDYDESWYPCVILAIDHGKGLHSTVYQVEFFDGDHRDNVLIMKWAPLG